MIGAIKRVVSILKGSSLEEGVLSMQMAQKEMFLTFGGITTA